MENKDPKEENKEMQSSTNDGLQEPAQEQFVHSPDASHGRVDGEGSTFQ